MSYAEKFYIAGGILAAAAVIVSFIGLRVEKFPGKYGVVVIGVFLAMIGVAATFSVLNGQEESEHRAHEMEHATEEAEHLEEDPVEEETPTGDPADVGDTPASGDEPSTKQSGAAAGGASTTLKLAASPDALAYDTTELTAKAGKVTIDFTNPSALQHDVAIEKDGQEIAKTEIITESEEPVSAELEAGDYTFLCTVPGHAEAGMQGTLKVE